MVINHRPLVKAWAKLGMPSTFPSTPVAIDDKLDASKANWFAALHSQAYLLVPGLFAHLQS